MNCCRQSTAPPTAPEARDTSNYRIVGQIALKKHFYYGTQSKLLVFLIFPFLYYIIGCILILFIVVSYIYTYFKYLHRKVGPVQPARGLHWLYLLIKLSKAIYPSEKLK